MTRTNKELNAAAVLERVQAAIAELTALENGTSSTMIGDRYHVSIKSWATLEKKYSFYIDEVCNELNIFDWWNETLSMSQLKQMEKFLKTAINMGYTGYVCFKVGAAGCSHGMWAYKNETTNGYSPDGETLFRGFRSDSYNEWDACTEDKTWLHQIVTEKQCFTLKEVKNMLAGMEV